jgi:hypothetical protein
MIPAPGCRRRCRRGRRSGCAAGRGSVRSARERVSEDGETDRRLFLSYRKGRREEIVGGDQGLRGPGRETNFGVPNHGFLHDGVDLLFAF